MGTSKRKVLVLFGGQSSEHEISCRSVVTILSNMDKEKYDPLIIGITKEGKWLKVSEEQVISGEWVNSPVRAVLSPDAVQQGVLILSDKETILEPVDVIFPVLHGMYGEDGTIQGLFEMAQIPYVGCGVLASAASMDKVYTKIIVDTIGVRQAAYVLVHTRELEEDIEKAAEKVEAKIPYPVFVKPSKSGSSKGISKAGDREALKRALLMAAEHDSKILVEETIIGRELECAVLGGRDVKASGVGEIVAGDEFYSYDAKYNSTESLTNTKPDLPGNTYEEIRSASVDIFRAVDGFGLSRVDFFLEKDTDQVVFNEINTLPGFTSISMYPMLWEDKGLDVKALITELIEMTCER